MRLAVGLLLGLILGVVGGFVPCGARAQVITLAELERQAVKNRPALDGDEAAVRAAQADVDKALAGYYPVMSLEGKTSLSPGNELLPLDTGSEYLVSATQRDLGIRALKPVARYGLSVDAHMSLYDFGRTSAAVEASRSKRAAVLAHADVTRQEITRLVRASYLAWLGATELLGVTEVAAKDAKERSERVSALISEGMRPRADLTPVQSDELLAQLELERARGDVAKRKLLLDHAVGVALPETAIPDRTLLDQGVPPERTEDPELRALELERGAADQAADALEQADNAVLGALGSVGMYGQNARPFPNYTIGIGISVPLLDGGADEASARAARAKSAGIDSKIREHEIATKHERRAISIDMENAMRRLVTAEALLASTTAQLAEAEARYDLGGGGIETIAVARAMMRRAHTELLLAKIARVEAALRALP